MSSVFSYSSNKLRFTIVLAFSLAGFFLKAQNPEVRNIILLIGDGMGLAHVNAAMFVTKGPLNIQRAQFIGISNTSSASDLITDSGAGGTAISTGRKTNNLAIGVDTNGKPLKTILEYAEEHQKFTGIVTTCNLTHATPASFVAHQPNRKMEAAIANDFINSGVDVLIGGGAQIFDSIGVTSSLKNKGFTISYSLKQAGNTVPMACFLAANHPVSIESGREAYLEEAVNKSLNLLEKNNNGFFLMVEGSQIDWAGHANNLNGVIQEVLDFDKAIGIAYDYADKNPGTLVIVTADHETGGLTLPKGDLKAKTISGAFASKEHTAIMVPVYAYGTGASAFSTFMDNTEIFTKMINAYGFSTKSK